MGLLRLLLAIAFVLLVFWLLKRLRRAPPSSKPPAAGDAALPLPMVACAHCGVHVARRDALPGSQEGYYCSAAHRQVHEQQSQRQAPP